MGLQELPSCAYPPPQAGPAASNMLVLPEPVTWCTVGDGLPCMLDWLPNLDNARIQMPSGSRLMKDEEYIPPAC